MKKTLFISIFLVAFLFSGCSYKVVEVDKNNPEQKESNIEQGVANENSIEQETAPEIIDANSKSQEKDITDEPQNGYKSVCDGGYILYGEKCITPNEFCLNSYSKHSEYDNVGKTCKCGVGYEYRGNSCEPKSLTCGGGYVMRSDNCFTYDQVCKSDYGDYSYYTGKIENGLFICGCPSGYTWAYKSSSPTNYCKLVSNQPSQEAVDSFNKAMQDLTDKANELKKEQDHSASNGQLYYECMAKVTPEELRILSPEQQQSLRETECSIYKTTKRTEKVYIKWINKYHTETIINDGTEIYVKLLNSCYSNYFYTGNNVNVLVGGNYIDGIGGDYFFLEDGTKCDIFDGKETK